MPHSGMPTVNVQHKTSWIVYIQIDIAERHIGHTDAKHHVFTVSDKTQLGIGKPKILNHFMRYQRTHRVANAGCVLASGTSPLAYAICTYPGTAPDLSTFYPFRQSKMTQIQ